MLINYVLAFAGPVILVVLLVALHIRVSRDDRAARLSSQNQPSR